MSRWNKRYAKVELSFNDYLRIRSYLELHKTVQSCYPGLDAFIIVIENKFKRVFNKNELNSVHLLES